VTIVFQPQSQTYYDYPVWTTPQYLGTFVQDYSFDINPITIVFGANPNTQITVLNGSLPNGLSFQQINNTLIISGSAVESTSVIESQITFRATQTNGGISDRTFFINLTPIIRAPSWAHQKTFLGYQSNISVSEYQINAVSQSDNRLIYDLPNNPDNAAINARTGIFSLNATPYTANQQVSTVIRATDSGTQAASNITVSVDIVTVPGPNWVTPAGSLGVFYSGDFVELNLLAEDPFDPNVIYVLDEPSQTLVGFGQVWDDDYGWDNDSYIHLPLQVSSDGLLYGLLPQVITNTTYTFKVVANSSNISSTAYFNLTNEPAINNKIFYWETTDTNLGTYNEGQLISISIKAVTTRGTTVIYNVTGGLPPPHLMLGSTSGVIQGFLEYCPINKTYWFEVTATDGYQSIIQQFSLTVNKVFGNQFLDAYIPLTGTLRNAWSADTANVRVREPGQIIYDRVYNQPDYPSLDIISGLETGYATPQDILSKIKPWFYELDLQIGQAYNTSVQSDGLSVIYRKIIDNQSGSNTSISSSSVAGGEIYPISINNIRNALIVNYPWVLSGSGNGFALIANLDWNTGAIQSVTILDSGIGYLSPPQLVVSGAGTGAELQAILGLVDVKVATAGGGWYLGQIFSISGNDAVDLAILQVTEVTPTGGIINLAIVSPGNYRNVGTSNIFQVIIGSAYTSISVSWGIVDVQVIKGGENYQCGITINTSGGELLPSWQDQYTPIIEVGEINPVTANLASTLLNEEPNSLYGQVWKPTYLVLQWQGLLYIGSTIFEENTTTFDGMTTRFEDTESPWLTVFDENQMTFDNSDTIFDYQDPLEYDLEVVWGGTLIDAGTTVFDLYSTILDGVSPRTYSNTRIRRWYNTQNKIYSANNAVT